MDGVSIPVPSCSLEHGLSFLEHLTELFPLGVGKVCLLASVSSRFGFSYLSLSMTFLTRAAFASPTFSFLFVFQYSLLIVDSNVLGALFGLRCLSN